MNFPWNYSYIPWNPSALTSVAYFTLKCPQSFFPIKKENYVAFLSSQHGKSSGFWQNMQPSVLEISRNIESTVTRS